MYTKKSFYAIITCKNHFLRLTNKNLGVFNFGKISNN